jgi:soluble lytic murein transglycosylase
MEKVIETKIRPSSSILSHLKVSTAFNKYLQSKINTDDSSLGYFQEEFQKTSRDLQDAIENGDLRLAKQLSTGLRRFYTQNKNFISEKRAFVGFIICAKAFFNKDKEEDAILLFEFARTIAPKEDFSDAHFYLIWPYVTTKDFKGLKKAISSYGLDKIFDRFDSKLQYWIALSEKTLGDSKKANEMFEKIITNNPYSFYSIISLKELALDPQNKISHDKLIEKLVSKVNPIEINSSNYALPLNNALKRLAVWTKLGSERFQTLELRKIQSLNKDDVFKDTSKIKRMTEKSHSEFVTLNLIKYLNSKKRYISSFKIFQEAIDQNDAEINYNTLKHIFPFNYFDVIKKNALNLDPLIIISLMRQESAFNPEAMSGVGAKGLMQLMPATAKRFNSKVKVKHLSNPEINVAIGTKYLRQLFSRFDGNIIYALASYNAGENRIDRWKRDLFKSNDPLSTIETIPYEETRNYVKLIYRNYFFYSLLQNKSILKVPLEDSFKLDLK